MCYFKGAENFSMQHQWWFLDRKVNSHPESDLPSRPSDPFSLLARRKENRVVRGKEEL